MGVSRPEVIIKEIDGEKCEPFEMVTIEVEETTRAPSWKNWVSVKVI